MKDNSSKNSRSSEEYIFSPIKLATLILTATAGVSAQTTARNTASEDGSAFWYVVIFALAAGLVGVVIWSLKSKKQNAGAVSKMKSSEINGNSLDAAKEMEWLRKNQKLVGKKERTSPSKKAGSARSANAAVKSSGEKINSDPMVAVPVVNDDANLYLPIFSIRRIEAARHFDPLPISNDGALMDAIEQTYEESEEDSEVRELSMRILAAFKTRNSVEALSQIALYDVLANLRSKAVAILGEFDHETVFEPILLACADPTREVRAAAARGLTKLTFDRGDAWTRIAELGEDGRIISAARAAIESGFVDMSFERLIHQDRKYAYEAFALMSMLITAGETGKIFDALKNHRDLKVRKALLHTIKITKNPKALEGLYNLLEKGDLPDELQTEVDRTIEEISCVAI